MKKTLLLCLVVAACAFGQTSHGDFTVATLPTGQLPGATAHLHDGSTTLDCTVGGGSSPVDCYWDGSSWNALVATALGNVTIDGSGNITFVHSVGAVSLTTTGNISIGDNANIQGTLGWGLGTSGVAWCANVFDASGNAISLCVPASVTPGAVVTTPGITSTLIGSGSSAGGVLSGTYPNPGLANGGVANAALANPATTVNGQTCTLGSTCTATAVPSGAAGGVLSGTYPNPGIANNVALPGNPTTTTQSQGDNSTKIATTAYTDTAASKASQGVANIISSSGAINTAETAIVSYTVPANSIKAGTEYQIEITGTCTATAANASNLRMRWGSNGPGASIGSDTQLATITPTSATSGTNQPFKATYNVVFQSATVALATGYLQNVSTLGINTTTAPVFSTSVGTTVTGLTTTSNEFLSFTYVSAATTTTSTFYLASIRLVKP